ncbi:MAG: ribonuclease HI [Ignavibacteria bacterium]|nr:ribonuclease HI [Ignavibacteria bacterium]
MVEIYTDGASLGNPGKGAFAVLIILNNLEIILSKGFRKTTNNRVELFAIIEALNFAKNNNLKDVIIYTDSQLITKAINESWLSKWIKNGWKTANKTPVINKDLWQKLNYFLNFVNAKFEWIEGHKGNKYNEIVDKLAKNKAKTDAIEIDYEYEKLNEMNQNG